MIWELNPKEYQLLRRFDGSGLACLGVLTPKKYIAINASHSGESEDTLL